MTQEVDDIFSLRGRRAIVTGAGGLLGRVFSSSLAERGAHVILLDRDAERTHEVAAALSREGHSTSVLVGDICDESWVVPAIRELGRAGSLDVLVNSAAVDPKMANEWREDPPRFTDYPVAAFRQSLDVNIIGTFLVTREVCRVMERQGSNGRGCIVNISSVYGLAGPDQRIYRLPDRAPTVKPIDYPTSKAGIIGFTRALAAYYARTEIRVNVLAPGGAFAGHDPLFAEAYGERTMLGRMARPTEYIGSIAFLCSDASTYMTGAVLVVDGGLTAW